MAILLRTPKSALSLRASAKGGRRLALTALATAMSATRQPLSEVKKFTEEGSATRTHPTVAKNSQLGDLLHRETSLRLLKY